MQHSRREARRFLALLVDNCAQRKMESARPPQTSPLRCGYQAQILYICGPELSL